MPRNIPTVAPIAPLLGQPKRPTKRRMLRKMALTEITPQRLRRIPDREILALHLRLHQLFQRLFSDPKVQRAGDFSRLQIQRLHHWVADEMEERGFQHHPVRALEIAPAELAHKKKGKSVEIAKAKRKGIYFVSPHGRWIFSGKKRLIVKKVLLKNLIGLPLVVVEDGLAYGEIILSKPFEIDLAHFADLEKFHRITPEERKEWWPGAKTFWGYGFTIKTKYDPPKKVKVPRGTQTFLREIKFIKAGELAGEPADEFFAETGSAALAIIFNPKGETFLVRRRNPPRVWSPPGGFLSGRHPATAAIEEGEEETGLKLEPLGHLPPSLHEGTHLFPFIFMAEGEPKLSREAEGGRFFSIEELETLEPLSPPYNIFRRAAEVAAKPTVDFVRARERPETLSPAELAENDLWLHILDQEKSDVHEILRAEMERRNIRHPEEEEEIAKRAFYRQEEIEEFFRGLPKELVVVPDWASLTGGSVYARPPREPKDVDWVFREPFPPQGTLLKFERLTMEGLERPAHFSFESSGASWPFVSVYDLVARKKDAAVLREVGEEGFEPFYKAALPTDAKDLRLFAPFAHYKAGGEFYPGEEDLLQRKWAGPALRRGGEIAVQEKFDGIRFLVHWKRGEKPKVFSETGRDRAALFPDLEKLLGHLKAESAILDTEFVEWTDAKPLPRWEMTWMVAGKEPKEGAKVRISVHDLPFLNGERITEVPYSERMKSLSKVLPSSLTAGALVLLPAQTRWVGNVGELNLALRWARQRPGSEGAMLKPSDFRYHGGAHPDIVKFKNVIEIDAAIIGWKKNPAPRPAGVKWTSQEALAKLPKQLEESRTYIFRCALRHRGKLIALESDKKLTSGDLELKWDEGDQKWKGTEDPKLWHMCPGFPNREAGEYAYANTYALALPQPPRCGQVLTVAPMQFRPFKREDGSFGYAWMFPRAKNIKEEDAEPAGLSETLAAFGFEPDEFLAKAADPLLHPPPEEGTYRYVIQHHARGKSVADYTPILIRDGNGPRVVPIASIFQGDHPAITEKPISGLEIWGRNGWEKIKYAFRHLQDDGEQMLRVNTLGGLLDATAGHSFFQNGKAVLGSSLAPGDRIDMQDSFPELSGDEFVDLEWAWVMGFFLAEGTISGLREREARFTQKELEPLNRVARWAKRYGFSYYYWKDNHANYLGVGGLSIWRDFYWTSGHSEEKKRSRMKIVPGFVFNWSAEARQAFIEGYICGDGTHGKRESHPWGFGEGSPLAAQGILWLMASLGVKGYRIEARPFSAVVRPLSKLNHNKTRERGEVTNIIPAQKGPSKFGEENSNFRGGHFASLHHRTKSSAWWYSPKKWVYDLETESHSFVAGIGLILAHNSVHADLRFEHDDYLIGWTIMDQVEGAIKEPILTLAQLRAADRDPKNWKMDWEKGVIRTRQIRGGVVRRGNLRVEAKAKQIPKDWFEIEGVTEKPDPAHRPPVGATRQFPGVFSTIDRGQVEYLAQKPWFFEYWLSGGKLKGRWVIRLLARRPTKGEAKEPAQPEVLPPGKEEERPREAAYFVLMQPLDQTPYVLSEEAIKKDWLPPKGFSALPKFIRAKIPPRLRYWTLSGEGALEARRELAKEFEELGGPNLTKGRDFIRATVTRCVREGEYVLPLTPVDA